MLNERLRISRELHDDIGSTLGSISIYSEVAKNRSEKNENADEAISKIGVASRELIDKMSDIVWSINPDNESFEQLQNRMQAFAAMMLTPRDIQNDFFVDDEVKKLQLSTEERKNVFLIFKEAVHNIVKYAECSRVEIRLSADQGEFQMSIHDDGKGFDISQLNSKNDLGGNGLKNMQARADDIRAILKIHSAIHGGSTIELRMGI
jgi:signal transduction histidine kinase